LCRKISQESFIDLYRKNRVYKQEGPVTWCIECQTAIAQAELEDLKRKTTLYTIHFDLRNSKEKIKIATTRPELLAACVAIFVNPNDKRYKNLVKKWVAVPLFKQEVPIMEDEKIDMEFGTGIVMVCTFGDRTDLDWWIEHKLPLKIVLDKEGRLNENAGKYKGLKLEEAKEKIIKDLKDKEYLIEQKEIEQTVNVHERCGTPIEFYISKQWYVRILDLKETFIELGDKINWYPEYMKIRYKQWVEGLNTDWCISRQRYYGIPFPVWYCKKCSSIILADEKDLPVDPIKDKPKKKCSCGSNDFEPDRDVMDTWATSALTPLINAKWKEKDNLMDKIYPMSLRPQGYDIIRTWAFSTIIKSYFHTNNIPWKDIMINGMGLDPKGKAMHKSRGNVIDPLEIKEKYSADALRFWVASAKLGNDLPFHEKDVVTGQRLLTKLWNASRFVSNFISKTEKPRLKIMDKWILDKLMKLVDESTNSFENYEYADAKREAETFFWHIFCDNYLEIVKHRAYANDESAKWTLYKTLLTLLKLFSPIIPFITEEIYQKLFRENEKDISIHISSWPEIENDFIDKEIEEIGDMTVAIISSLRQYKSKKGLALNSPIKKLIIECDENTKEKLEETFEDIKGTMNVKEIEFGKGKFLVEGYKIKLGVI
jgi:valyl-tRNA synthetase